MGQVHVVGAGPPAAVVPAVRAPYRVVPAPRPLGDVPVLSLDDGWPRALRRRLERLRDDSGGVLVRALDAEPAGLDGAVQAALRLLPGGALADGALRVRHLGLRLDLDAATCTPEGPSRCPEATALLASSSGACLLLTTFLLACSDDLVVLRRTGAGTLAAELMAVAFPSGWAPRRLAGADLRTLHAPVADNTRLQRAAPALSAALLTKGPLQQHVWGLEPSGRLDDDPSAPDARTGPPPADPARWWLRVEQQRSVPLPELGRALFFIRPHLRPLVVLAPEQRLALAEAVEGMSTAARRYKGLTDVADSMVRWLRDV